MCVVISYIEHRLTIVSGYRQRAWRACTTSTRNGEQTRRPGCECISKQCRTEDGETQTVRRPPCAKWYIYTSPSRILQEEMEKLEDLSRKSLAIRTVHTFIFI